MANVSKADLTEAVAKAAAISKTAAGEAVNAVFDEVVAQVAKGKRVTVVGFGTCLLYTSPSPRDRTRSRMPSSA